MKRPVLLMPLMIAGCVARELPNGTEGLRADNYAVAKAMAVREVVEELDLRRQNGEPLTPAFLELEYTWSRRMAESECSSTKDDQARMKAIEAHLQRMKHIEDILTGATDPTQLRFLLIEQARYYVAEAELWVARAGK